MIGYIHLQVDVRDLLILYLDLRNLQRGVELRVVECSRSLCLDTHHSLGVDLLRLQSLQLIQANARGGKLRVITLLPRPNTHLALHVARGKLHAKVAVHFISSACEGQRRRRDRLIVSSDMGQREVPLPDGT